MSDEHQVVAIGLLTERDLSVLGQGFQRIFRIEDGHDFGALLAAIDDADHQRMQVAAHRMPAAR